MSAPLIVFFSIICWEMKFGNKALPNVLIFKDFASPSYWTRKVTLLFAGSSNLRVLESKHWVLEDMVSGESSHVWNKNKIGAKFIPCLNAAVLGEMKIPQWPNQISNWRNIPLQYGQPLTSSFFFLPCILLSLSFFFPLVNSWFYFQ